MSCEIISNNNLQEYLGVFESLFYIAKLICWLYKLHSREENQAFSKLLHYKELQCEIRLPIKRRGSPWPWGINTRSTLFHLDQNPTHWSHLWVLSCVPDYELFSGRHHHFCSHSYRPAQWMAPSHNLVRSNEQTHSYGASDMWQQCSECHLTDPSGDESGGHLMLPFHHPEECVYLSGGE